MKRILVFLLSLLLLVAVTAATVSADPIHVGGSRGFTAGSASPIHVGGSLTTSSTPIHVGGS
jgi:uncharacterized protein YxeA